MICYASPGSFSDYPGPVSIISNTVSMVVGEYQKVIELKNWTNWKIRKILGVSATLTDWSLVTDGTKPPVCSVFANYTNDGVDSTIDIRTSSDEGVRRISIIVIYYSA